MKNPFHRGALFAFAFWAIVSVVRADDALFGTNAPAAAAPASTGLQPGDLVGICGDSITEQKIYSVDIADYLLMCQPQSNLSAVQFGWSGETASGFAARMKNDAFPFKPTVVTTCYGMNDGGYNVATPQILDNYRRATTAIVQNFKAAGIRVIVVGSPGAVDTYYYGLKGGRATSPEVYNKTLGQLTQVAKKVAVKEGVGFADVHDVMVDVMAKAKAVNGRDFAVAGMDGVHPQADGALIMAYAFLKGLGCDGNIGTITVDLKAGTAEATPGTTVISDSNGTVELESTRYPFCFPVAKPKDSATTRSILPFLPFNDDLNRYTLVVKNAPAHSLLKVTWGQESKVFHSGKLAEGINLAAEFFDNPFAGQFAAVQSKIQAQQAFETLGSKTLLHSFLAWEAVPGAGDILNSIAPQLTDKILTNWKSLRDASAAAVVPVKHEIKIEAAP